MRRHLLAATALTSSILFLVPGALAQSVPFDWNGAYAGLLLGSAKGNTHFDFTGSVSNSDDVPVLGPSGTVTFGVNKQLGNFVFGLAADGSLLNLKGNGSTGGGSIETSLDRLFAVRGRLGFTSGSLLYFATAGIAAGHESFDTDVFGIGADPLTQRPALGDGYVYGPTYGLGVEIALTKKISLTGEGLVTNLSSLTASGDNGKSNGGYTAVASTSNVMLRGGVNFHF